LCFVNHYELLLELSTAKECDRLERELSAIGEVVNESNRIAT
jgi:hypothetical protein